jgi:hypothetical protein
MQLQQKREFARRDLFYAGACLGIAFYAAVINFAQSPLVSVTRHIAL